MKFDDVDDPKKDHDQEHEAAKPPSVEGEENPFSGDATSSESPVIDDELQKVGLHGDEDGVKELDVAKEIDEEEK